MAWNVFAWARRQPLPPSQKVVLILLADHAKKDGSDARPSVDTLARDSGLSRRAVSKALFELRCGETRDGKKSDRLAAGLPRLIQALAYPRGGHGRATVWRLCLENDARGAPMNDAADAPFEPKNDASDDNNGAPGSKNDARGAPQSPEPFEPKEETSETPPPLERCPHGKGRPACIECSVEDLAAKKAI